MGELVISGHAQTMRSQLEYPATEEDHLGVVVDVEEFHGPKASSVPRIFPALPSLNLNRENFRRAEAVYIILTRPGAKKSKILLWATHRRGP